MNPIIKIQKFKFVQDKVELQFSKEVTIDGEHYRQDYTVESDLLPHTELKEGLEELKKHFALICEETESKDIEGIKKKELSRLKITGFHLKQEGAAICITGGKVLTNGKHMNFSAPLQKIDDEEYAGQEHLVELLRNLEGMILEYIQGKHAPDPQLSIFAADLPVLKVA